MKPGQKIALILAALLLVSQSAWAAESVPTDSQIIHIASSTNQTPKHLTLALNKAAMVELDTNVRDVLVSNPDIVDAVVRTPRRIFILSLKVGQTNVFFTDAHGNKIASLDVRVEPDVSALAQTIQEHLPNSSVNVESLNDNIVLTGTVDSAQDASTAQNLAAGFVGSPNKVVNKLRVNGRQQVLIKVEVSEMSRTIAKQFGVDVSTAMRSAGVPIIASTSNPYGLMGRALSDLSGVQIGQVCQGGTSYGFSPTDICNPKPNNAQGVMKALEQVGLVHTLAEPNLTASSGESAKFLAGGEFPVPTSRDRDGNVIVTFKQFGVGLAFTPVVLNDNNISLQISTEVSQLTNEGALFLQGTSSTAPGLTVPALAVRRTNTTVDLPSGGSLVIGGLLQKQTKQDLDAFPGLKDLPVLGALFRSRDFQNNETELVVMVTAYLVKPVAPKQIAMPDKGFAPAADFETIFFGRINAVYGKGHDVVPKEAQGKTGYIIK